MARFSSLSALALVLVAAAAALLSPPSSFFALALPGEGAAALAEGAIAAVPTAACGAAMLKSMYCRVLQDPDALSGGTSGCCGNSTQIIVTPGVRDSRNSTVSYVPKSAEDCHLRCAADSTCLTASAFSNKGNLFCNMFAASTCRYSRLQCNPTDSDAPTFVVHGSWLFPCRSPKGGISEDDTALCTVGHGHGVDGWHEGHGVFVSGGNGGGGHNHG